MDGFTSTTYAYPRAAAWWKRTGTAEHAAVLKALHVQMTPQDRPRCCPLEVFADRVWIDLDGSVRELLAHAGPTATAEDRENWGKG